MECVPMSTSIDLEALRAQCAGPGKFEGEEPATPYYYDLSLNGEGESLDSSEDGDGADLFHVEDDERAAFGFDADVTAFLLEWDSQGFVRGTPLTAADVTGVHAEVERRRIDAIRDSFLDSLRIDYHAERGEVSLRLLARCEELGVDEEVYSWDTEAFAEDVDAGFLDVSGIFGGREIQRGPLKRSAIETATMRGDVAAALARAIGEVTQ